MTEICVPLSPRTTTECCHKIATLASRCDLFEIRADAFEETPDLYRILHQTSQPIIWTHRSPEEGGRPNPRQPGRLGEYRRALELGVRWIDVEWKSGLVKELAAFRERLVLSLHDFDTTPGDLLQSVSKMAQVPCAVVKIVTQINCTEHLLKLVEAAQWLKKKNKSFVVAGMGDDGTPIRALSPLLDCEWTYVALDVPTASGQLTEADLELYRFGALHSGSRLFAVIGNPVAHSRSPWFHNSAYREMGLNAVYVAIRVDDLGAYLKLSDRLGISGWSVTLPWKAEMAKLCVLQDSASRMSGVVNTVRREGERFLGWNTDWSGFIEPIHKRRPLSGLRACVVGTGGGARTAVAALLSEGAHVTVLGRRPGALQVFARDFSVQTGLLADTTAARGDLIVNATSAGMSPGEGSMPVTTSLLERFQIAYDLVYTPPLTMFLRAAQKLGLQTIPGWEMFVQQAAEQVKIFTGSAPPSPWLNAQLGDCK